MMNATTETFDRAALDWDSDAYRVERARLIAEQIQDLASENLCNRVLDFGCGTGLLGFHFVDKAQHVDFADTSTGMLAQVEKKALQAKLTNTSTLCLGERKLTEDYELIITLMALHHIENHVASIAELISHLAPGGRIVLCDLDTEDGSFHGDAVVPHNGFDRESIAALLRKEGLSRIHVSTVHTDRRKMDSGIKEYPIFLVSGKRES